MKNTKGITLIALIVTIIVLLILSSVTLNVLIGDNGILTKAKNARAVHEKTEICEQIKMSITTKQIENSGIFTKADLESVLEIYGEVKKEDGEIVSVKLSNKNYEIPISEIYTGLFDE